MRRRPESRRERFACPHCGAEVAAGRAVCRECGSDAATGWLAAQEVDYRSVEIPDGYGPGDDGSGGVGAGLPRWLVVTALVVVAAMVAALLWRW
ncbi:MAG: hypothetical protein KF830_13015 [Planctomycetes bacterium]|nr:hypothetical protein [Planctomycetota bacterium]